MSDIDQQLFDRAVAVLPGGNTRATLFVAPHPPYAVRGKGAEVTDVDGHVVIDCNNNYTALIHGHADAEILDVARTVAAEGTAFGLPTRFEIEMAEALRDRTGGMAQWRFCNSGTEAVMMLIRAARAYTGRDIIIRFEGSYHGTYDAVVPPTAKGVPAALTNTVIEVPQGDIDAVERVLEKHRGQVAAVLIDLMPNRAGLKPASAEAVSRLDALVKRHDVLLAVDEVITFRLEYGGLHSRYGITPDLVSLGKVIGGGFPVGAVGGRAEVLSSFSPLTAGPVSWGGTFSANPVTMAAGLTALRRLTPAVIADLNARGDALRSRLSEAGVPANGSGSLVRLVFSEPTRSWWALYRAGVLVGTNGLIALSTAMTDEHIATIGDAVIAVHAENTKNG
ncbi:aminotransferase class III-fold pyridoxal phosphate-dependent enzyme [Mycolicibacterium goodii]|uniref:aspartate aminotransferase family protein n=1 Tax=Mycolicibacterium goodii TaxID=134601 RepID=UPI001BDDB97C|nr:aminotransferase class III-fold pyridoxal phosphate-dependent enzyme [Mycolicibacterium goodii]MBU8808324.1 aminotransferase class III-fold pyridoxal phosphate-dependent enzyme [Mycolicibacterium goodii]